MGRQHRFLYHKQGLCFSKGANKVTLCQEWILPFYKYWPIFSVAFLFNCNSVSNICEHFKVTCGIVVVCETWGVVDLSKCFSPVEGHQNEVNWSKDNNSSSTVNFLILAWPNGWVSGKKMLLLKWIKASYKKLCKSNRDFIKLA